MNTEIKGPRYALRIALIYFIISALWIFFSDRFINSGTIPGFTDLQLQTYKGWLFVIVTSSLLYVLIQRGMSAISRSRERMRESLREKEYLLRELNHRVRNNLAIIAGMIELEGEEVQNDEARNVLLTTGYRIHALGNIQKLFYGDGEVSRVPFHRFLSKQVDNMCAEGFPGERITCDIDELSLNINQAVPLSLLICEILSQIRLQLNAEEELQLALKLSLKSNGQSEIIALFHVEYPNAYPGRQYMNKDALVENPLVEAYSAQLEGELNWREEGNTSEVEIRFEMAEESGSAANKYFQEKD